MAEEWKLKAIHKQFDVFEELTEPHRSFNILSDLGNLIDMVRIVVRKHLEIEPTSGVKAVPVRKISTNLINCVPEKENTLQLSYVVVVYEKNKGELYKCPIFRVKAADKLYFVDVLNTVYSSWDTFMKENGLPNCEFCFPVNGNYEYGKSLKIDFAKSPAACRYRRMWYFIGGVIVGSIIVIATYGFSTPPLSSKYVVLLNKVVEIVMPKLSDALTYLKDFSRLIFDFKKGTKSNPEILLAAFKVLSRFYSEFKEDIMYVLEKIKNALSSAYDYLFKLFGKFFEKASSQSQTEFLAIVEKQESEINNAKEEACVQLNEMKDEMTSSQSSANCVTTLCTFNDISYNKKIFLDCMTESALVQKLKSEEFNNSTHSQSFNPTIENLLVISKNIASHLQVEHLSDVKDIFESLCLVVSDEFRNRVHNYVKGVKAARAAAGSDLSLDTYNTSLGIVGDVRDHLMNEAVQSVQETRLMIRLKETIQEMKRAKKIVLIPIYRKSENDYDDDVGVYKSIGVRGVGKFSAQTLLNVLKESFVEMVKENDFTFSFTNEDSVIFIRSEEISVFAYQEENEENTSEGVIYINRSC